MAQSFLLCLILAEAFLALAMATTSDQNNQQHIVRSSSKSEAEAPSTIRKLGKHQAHGPASAAFNLISMPPSEAPRAAGAEQEIDLIKKKDHHHRSVDKSVAGGGVILGGLATTFLVAVFCYIRATGRHKAQDGSNHQITV